MNQFFSFLKKEFHHILRDKRTMIILLVMPIVQIVLFGFAISTEIRNIDIAVFDQSKDETSRKLITKIADNPYFSLVKIINNAAEVEKTFQNNSCKLILIIPPKFEQTLFSEYHAGLQILADAVDPNESGTMNMYLSNVIMEFQQQLSTTETPIMIDVNTRMLYNPELKSAYDFVPGVMALIMIIVCAMMTSISIVKEKEMGTMEVLLASPIQPIIVILAKLTPYFVLSFLNIATILFLAKFLLGLPILVNSLPLIFLISMLYIVVSLALGLFISTVTESQQVAMLMSLLGLMLPNLLLSGMIFPRENMPSILQLLSNIPPATWYIMALKTVMIKNLSFIHILQPFFILLGMAILLITVSLRKFKIRL